MDLFPVLVAGLVIGGLAYARFRQTRKTNLTTFQTSVLASKDLLLIADKKGEYNNHRELYRAFQRLWFRIPLQRFTPTSEINWTRWRLTKPPIVLTGYLGPGVGRIEAECGVIATIDPHDHRAILLRFQSRYEKERMVIFSETPSGLRIGMSWSEQDRPVVIDNDNWWAENLIWAAENFDRTQTPNLPIAIVFEEQKT